MLPVIRREEEIINDIDIVIIPGSHDLHDIMSNIFEKINKFGSQIINGIYYYKEPVLVDFFITTRKELPYSMSMGT